MRKSAVRESLILAGGLGMRLRAVVSDRPKPLADVRGEAFVLRLFGQLERAGIARAVLCTGYRAAQTRRMLGSSFGSMRLEYSAEPRPFGTGGALRLGAERVRGADVLAMNGDSFCALDLAAFVAAHLASGAEATVAAAYRRDRAAAGALRMDSSGRIIDFASRAPDSACGFVNAGVYVFRRSALLRIPSRRKVSLEAEVLPDLAARGSLRGWEVPAGFIDIGTPKSYWEAQHSFRWR